MKYSYLLLSILICTLSDIGAAQNKDKNVVHTGKAVSFGQVGNVFEQQDLRDENEQLGKLAPPREGEINRHQLSPVLLRNANATTNATGSSAITSSFSLGASPSVDISSPGYSSDDNSNLFGFRVTPPDTNGDVGLTQYVQYVNLGWVVFDKATGQQITNPTAGNSFWQSLNGSPCQTQNAGDPIVLYDHLAGRWLFSQFVGASVPDGHQCFAISDGPELNEQTTFTLYDFIINANFNDYPKIGLTQSAYAMTTHEFTNPGFAFVGVTETVFDRAAMLAGDPNAGFVQFTGSTSGDDLDFGVQPGHLEGFNRPADNGCHYLVHATDTEAFGIPGFPVTDLLRFWEACVDFANPGAATLSQISSIVVPEFDQNFCGFDRNCIDQNSSSGQLLDGLAGFTMYRFNNRYFPDEGVLKGVVTTNVDVGGDRAGVLWAGIDINPKTDVVSIGDGGALLGVVDFNDNLNRWMGSASVDHDGNIGIGYTVAGPGVFPSIAVTVHERGVNNPGEVQAESFCVEGTGSHEGANRWADYASTSVDPVDNCEFFHTNEYVETTGAFQWNTRVCSFKLDSCSFLLGDVNLDAVVNLLDIQPFVALLSSGKYLDEGDINRDGVISLLDVNPFVELISGQ